MRKRRIASSSVFVFFKYNLLHRSAKLANPLDRFDHESNSASGSPFLDSRPLSILILQLLWNLRSRDQKFLKRELEQMRLWFAIEKKNIDQRWIIFFLLERRDRDLLPLCKDVSQFLWKIRNCIEITSLSDLLLLFYFINVRKRQK